MARKDAKSPPRHSATSFSTSSSATTSAMAPLRCQSNKLAGSCVNTSVRTALTSRKRTAPTATSVSSISMASSRSCSFRRKRAMRKTSECVHQRENGICLLLTPLGTWFSVDRGASRSSPLVCERVHRIVHCQPIAYRLMKAESVRMCECTHCSALRSCCSRAALMHTFGSARRAASAPNEE